MQKLKEIGDNYASIKINTIWKNRRTACVKVLRDKAFGVSRNLMCDES